MVVFCVISGERFINTPELFSFSNLITLLLHLFVSNTCLHEVIRFFIRLPTTPVMILILTHVHGEMQQRDQTDHLDLIRRHSAYAMSKAKCLRALQGRSARLRARTY